MKPVSILCAIYFIAASASAVSMPKERPDDGKDMPFGGPKMEAGFCVDCEKKAHDSIDKLKVASEQIDQEATKRHIERQKEREIRKISEADCPGAEDGGQELDLPMDRSSGPDRDGLGKKEMGGKPGRGNASKENAESKKILAIDPEYMDDIQDAIDAKASECKKLAKKKMVASMRDGQHVNLETNSMGQMNGMNNMNAMSMVSPMVSMLMQMMMMGRNQMGGTAMNAYGANMGNYGMNSINSYGATFGSPYSSMFGSTIGSQYGNSLNQTMNYSMPQIGSPYSILSWR